MKTYLANTALPVPPRWMDLLMPQGGNRSVATVLVRARDRTDAMAIIQRRCGHPAITAHLRGIERDRESTATRLVLTLTGRARTGLWVWRSLSPGEAVAVITVNGGWTLGRFRQEGSSYQLALLDDAC